MKKQLFGGLCIAALMSACTSQVPDNEYRIEGTLTGVPDGTVITLWQDIDNRQNDTVIGGHFFFSDTLSTARKFFLSGFDPGFSSLPLEIWVTPGERVEVTGRDKLITFWNVRSNIPEQAELNDFTDCAHALLWQQVMVELQRDSLMSILANGQRDGLGTATLQQARSQMDSLQRLLFQLQYQISQKSVEYMRATSFPSLWMDKLEVQAKLVRSASMDMGRLSELTKDFKTLEQPVKELYAALPDSLKQTAEARRIYNLLYPLQLVSVGDAMADGPLYDPEGKEHRLAEFKGKYILLDFWSRGCPPCLQSIPELEKISTTYADRLAVVSISSDPEEVWKEFLKEKGLKGNQWNELRNDGGGLASAYKVQGIPHYVLIAPDGKVAAMWSGYGEGSLEQKIKENLK